MEGVDGRALLPLSLWSLWAALLLERLCCAILLTMFGQAGSCCLGMCLAGPIGAVLGAEAAEDITVTRMFVLVGSMWHDSGDDPIMAVVLLLASNELSIVLLISAIVATVRARKSLAAGG